MNALLRELDFGDVVHVRGPEQGAVVLVVCEHASRRVPDFMGAMGLDDAALTSHIAWDPHALEVAEAFSDRVGATLVAGGVSRLVYDCNRPPDAHDAIPVRSEVFDIPANAEMTEAERKLRIAKVYEPFQAALSNEILKHRKSLELLVTIHSFTPVYRGRTREVEVGILHGADDRFAHAMMARIPDTLPYEVRLNEPYSQADGVAHTLNAHGVRQGLLSVMLEIRNDLIATPDDRERLLDNLMPWLCATAEHFRLRKPQ